MTNVTIWDEISGHDWAFVFIEGYAATKSSNPAECGRAALWSSGTFHSGMSGSMAPPSCNVGFGIEITGVVGTGGCVVSRNGICELLVQTDGKLVLYDRRQNPAAAIWSTGTALTPFSPGVGLQTLSFYDALGNLTCVDSAV